VAVRAARGAQAASDEERWQQAVDLARGRPTPAALSGRRRAARRFLLGMAAVAVLSAAAGAVVGWLSASGDVGGSATGAGPEWLRWATFTAGVLLVVVGAVLGIRAGNWGGAWRAPTTVLTRRQRREAVREMRGRVPARPEHLPVVLDLARRWSATEGFVLVLAGNCAIQLSALVDGGSRPLRLLSAAAAALFLWLAGAGLVERHRAQRFLDQQARPGS
jgi:hypothetical protein